MSEPTFVALLLDDGRTLCRRSACWEAAPRLGTRDKRIARYLTLGAAAGRSCAGCGETLNPATLPSQSLLLGAQPALKGTL